MDSPTALKRANSTSQGHLLEVAGESAAIAAATGCSGDSRDRRGASHLTFHCGTDYSFAVEKGLIR
jgi:hypothetical protein